MAATMKTSIASMSHHPCPCSKLEHFRMGMLVGGNENLFQIAEDAFPILLEHLRIVTLHLDDSIRNVLALGVIQSHANSFHSLQATLPSVYTI